MQKLSNYHCRIIMVALILLMAPAIASAQETPKVLSGAELTRVVPAGFYFQGQSAPTQMRNSAAVQFGENRYVIAGLVDTSGYSSEVRGQYQGLFITDSPITVGGATLATGAYGFGFSSEGKMNILDLGGKQVLSVATQNDKELQRPRPLMMVKGADGVRFYNGRNYVLLAAQ